MVLFRPPKTLRAIAATSCSLLSMAFAGCESSLPQDGLQSEFAGSGAPDVAVQSAAVICGAADCADATQGTPCTNFGHWPGGQIPFKFSGVTTAAQRTSIRQAMDDWERITNSMIHFNITTAAS